MYAFLFFSPFFHQVQDQVKSFTASRSFCSWERSDRLTLQCNWGI